MHVEIQYFFLTLKTSYSPLNTPNIETNLITSQKEKE